MAVVTGTLLLRPAASRGSFAATVPADTPVEEIYKLINEEVADDDATTFQPTYTSGEAALYNPSLLVKFSLPEGVTIVSIENIRHISRQKATQTLQCFFSNYSEKNSLTGRSSCVWSANGDGSSWANSVNDKDTLTDANWETVSVAIAEALNNDDFAMAYNAGAKSTPPITQIYIELDCTYEEAGTPLYFKQNGEWAELSGNIYQKANGEWLEADVSVLSGEFPVEEVTI